MDQIMGINKFNNIANEMIFYYYIDKRFCDISKEDNIKLIYNYGCQGHFEGMFSILGECVQVMYIKKLDTFFLTHYINLGEEQITLTHQNNDIDENDIVHEILFTFCQRLGINDPENIEIKTIFNTTREKIFLMGGLTIRYNWLEYFFEINEIREEDVSWYNITSYKQDDLTVRRKEEEEGLWLF